MFSRKPEKNNRKAIHGELNGLLSGFLARKRLQAVKPYIKGCNRICDIGCGIYCWEGIIDRNTHYVGLDIEDDIIRYNREHFRQTFYTKDVERNDLTDLGTDYDLVIMLAVLEHFTQPGLVLKTVRNILAPNGLVILTTPHPCSNFVLNAGAKIRLFSNDKHTHHELFNRCRINEIAEAGKFRLKGYKRFLFGFNQLAVLAAEAD